MDLMHDINPGPPSPSKGKAVDPSNKSQWRAGWWDFYPLLERPKRPLQWSQSSVIFTAHPTQALITGRHFSSSKQFILPSPLPLVKSPGSYDPPSVLSVAPGDLWLFAYFPRRDGEGVGCLWKRGPQIDHWLVNESWTYPKGGGAVAASWIGARREWTNDAQGNPMRLPPRGPPTPVSDPNLLVVTEDNWLHLTFLRYYQKGVKFIKRPLSVVSVPAYETTPVVDVGDHANYTRRCTDAAFGMAYNETTMFIATHSARVPPPPRQTVNTPSFNSMDLSVPVGLPSMNVPDQKVLELETWGDERTIEVHEVILRFDGINIVLFSSLIISQKCETPLTNLTFACAPPLNNQASVDSNSLPKRNVGKIYLITSSTNFHDYIQPPTSTLNSYSFVHRPTVTNPRNAFWTLQEESSFSIGTGLVSFIRPFLDFTSPNCISMYTCILDPSGSTAAGQKEATIGTTKVYSLPDFSINTNWEPSLIKCPIASLGRDLPLLTTSSPNRALLCTFSFSHSMTRTVHSLPTRSKADASDPMISHELAVAILARVTMSDLVHTICSPHMSRTEATHVIYHTLSILDKYHNSQIPFSSTWDIVGIASEVYRTRSQHAKEASESELLKDLWQTAHDICSLAACNSAFEDCAEREGYDLDSVWQLISVCSWVVGFTEKLMKACILSSNSLVIGKSDSDPIDFDGLNLPILLHLSHPFALQNLITALNHVKDLRSYLGSLPAGGEHAKVAQVVLIDTVDCSGVNFGELVALLVETVDSAKSFEPHEFRMALAGCQPTPAMRPRLGRLLLKISQSKTILNKSTLFIKPFDLVDGIGQLSMSSHHKNDERDVITKNILDKQGSKKLCLRCGGRTSVGSKESHIQNPKWSVWELTWQLRCICGGLWISV